MRLYLSKEEFLNGGVKIPPVKVVNYIGNKNIMCNQILELYEKNHFIYAHIA